MKECYRKIIDLQQVFKDFLFMMKLVINILLFLRRFEKEDMVFYYSSWDFGQILK